MNIHPVGAELFHADRQTDMTKLIATFHNSANAPKNPLFEGRTFLCVAVERGKGRAYAGGLIGKS